MYGTTANQASNASVFIFSGQAILDPWTFTDAIQASGWSRYDAMLSQEPELFLHRLRDLVVEFPTWQNRARRGRPAACERTVLASLVLRQFFKATYRQIESILRITKDFMGFNSTYDANTLSRKNRSRRFEKLFRRFQAWILKQAQPCVDVVATDATGYSALKQAWRTTNHQARGNGDWIKSHAVVQVPQLLYLNSVQTPGNVHDSKAFLQAWQGLPDGVRPRRSLADAAYIGRGCLAAARSRGATPIHAIKKNAKWARFPGDDYQRMVRFQRQFPDRARRLKARRALVETTFHCTKNRFGDRISSRTPIAKANEIQAKEIGHNIRIIVMREGVLSTGV